jgi:hypothetical protein
VQLLENRQKVEREPGVIGPALHGVEDAADDDDPPAIVEAAGNLVDGESLFRDVLEEIDGERTARDRSTATTTFAKIGGRRLVVVDQHRFPPAVVEPPRAAGLAARGVSAPFSGLRPLRGYSGSPLRRYMASSAGLGLPNAPNQRS